MKLPKFFGRPRKPSLYVRRVAGRSMLPTLHEGQLLVVVRWPQYQVGNVVLFEQSGREMVKRICRFEPDGSMVVRGDNQAESTDSRNFGAVSLGAVRGMVVWPWMRHIR